MTLHVRDAGIRQQKVFSAPVQTSVHELPGLKETLRSYSAYFTGLFLALVFNMQIFSLLNLSPSGNKQEEGADTENQTLVQIFPGVLA